MKCTECGLGILEKEVYIHEGQKMCEDCFIDVSRFPLGHTGMYRDKIGGDRRRLNIVRD